MALIKASDLSVGYDSEVVAGGISFTLNEGDYLYIIGENGSGKTTLMKTILGLQKELSGTIEIGDGLSQKQIGYLPQHTNVQKDFPASVWEIVLSGCQGRTGLRPFYSKADKELAEKNMERMGITELRNRSYRELSGGQQQRVLLARALCAADRVMLLDEPVSGLDPMVTEDMYSLISDLNKSGLTIIMISHDLSAALRYASHILHIGDKMFFGSKEEYEDSAMGKFFVRGRKCLIR